MFLFGAYALVDGAVGIIAAVRSVGRDERWWLLLVEVGVLLIALALRVRSAPRVHRLRRRRVG